MKYVLLALAAALPAFAAHALDFKSVGANPAVAYDAPSEKPATPPTSIFA